MFWYIFLKNFSVVNKVPRWFISHTAESCTMPSFLCGWGALNSASHGCTANTSITEPTSSPHDDLFVSSIEILDSEQQEA